MEPLTIIFAGLAIIATVGILLTLIFQKKHPEQHN